MPRELPPLNAVRAFEAAARNLSMALAARELGVSAGAVSQQVRQLEDYFETRLFLRGTRKISLTSAGQACLPALTEGLDRIEEAVHRLTQAQKPGRVTVSVETSFAERWLIPRLTQFNQVYPEIVVELVGRPIDPETMAYKTNIAIAYGPRRYQGLIVERIMEEGIFPVCSPAFAARHRLKHPTDLRGIPLLHDDTMGGNAWFPDWQDWLTAQGVHDIDTAGGHRFTVAGMALESARQGQGIVLGRGALVERDLASETLTAPFGTEGGPSFDYYTVGLQAALELPQVALFRDWLMEEGSKTHAVVRLAS
jgi:LysR family glycine cleavage system transcriptional activator